MSESSLDLIATCALGLEGLLAGELEALGMAEVSQEQGAVRFRGDWNDCWRANLWLRTANRVLVSLAKRKASDGEALYQAAVDLVSSDRTYAGVAVADLFAPERTLSVRATSTRSQVRDVRWVGLRVKDGIVDGQRARFGQRSSVDRAGAGLPLRVWLHEDRLTLLLDTSREPLDRRGYRARWEGASLREQLAAACVLASGWNGEGPVLDPMCGSGTLLIEAAWWRQGRPPGLSRPSWVFEQLPGFDPRRFAQMKSEISLREPPALFGVDSDAEALEAARRSAETAGVADRLQLTCGDGLTFDPPEGPGLLLVNPPWGDRLESSPELFRQLGDCLKKRYSGWRAVVLAGDQQKGKTIGLRARPRYSVRNGPVDARILVFDLY